MDELALLGDFRLDDAAADGAREHAREALQAAMSRRRRSRRRYVIALSFAVAVLLAAGAYAIVREFVVGAPAPRDVNAQVKFQVGHFFDDELIPWRGHPRKTAGPTLVVAAVQASGGPVYLLLTPLQGGGECLSVWPARDRAPDGRPWLTNSSCSFGKPLRPRAFAYGTQNSTSGPVTVGYAPGAVRVRVGDRFFDTPFGWFVIQPRVRLTAYGAHGGVVARVTLREASRPTNNPSPTRPAGPVVPIKPARVIVSTRTGWTRASIKNLAFKWIYTNEPLHVAVAAASQGTRCIYAYVTPPRTDDIRSYCGWPRLRANDIQVFPSPVGWTSASRRTWVTVLVLLGEAGGNIAHVEVRFSDGSSAPTTLREGVIFYQVPRENFSAGHRPTEIVGRDAGGHVVARKRLPFVR